MDYQRGKGVPCAYCKRALAGTTARSGLMATRDHVKPQWLGGGRTVWACFTCNNLKGGMLPAQWTAFMEANPEWWKNGPRPFSRDRVARPKWVAKPKTPIDYTVPAENVRELARKIVAQEFTLYRAENRPDQPTPEASTHSSSSQP